MLIDQAESNQLDRLVSLNQVIHSYLAELPHDNYEIMEKMLRQHL